MGTQYRSAVFTTNAEQAKVAAELMQEMRDEGAYDSQS